MQSPHIPWNILSSSVGVGILTDGWNLADPDQNPDNARTFIVNVAFVSPFSLAPVVHLGLTGFDADQRDTSRITVKADRITESGFQARISTWASTRVYAVEFNWLAIGA